jgi:hypothetical protein
VAGDQPVTIKYKENDKYIRFFVFQKIRDILERLKAVNLNAVDQRGFRSADKHKNHLPIFC